MSDSKNKNKNIPIGTNQKKRRAGSSISEIFRKYEATDNPVTKGSYRSILFNRLDRIEEIVEYIDKHGDIERRYNKIDELEKKLAELEKKLAATES